MTFGTHLFLLRKRWPGKKLMLSTKKSLGINAGLLLVPIVLVTSNSPKQPVEEIPMQGVRVVEEKTDVEFTHVVEESAPEPEQASVGTLLVNNKREEIMPIKIEHPFKKGTCTSGASPQADLLLFNVNKQNKIPDGYIPNDLYLVPDTLRTNYPMCLRLVLLPNLVEMFSDAKKAGHEIGITSAYRSQAKQQELFNYWTGLSGDRALDAIAVPGHSEHQLGLAVDLTGKSVDFTGGSSKFGKTSEGKWLNENAHKYGFVLSYPKGKKNITGYKHEPWHFRFVGKETAKIIYDKSITKDEWLQDITPLLVPDTNEPNLFAQGYISILVSNNGSSRMDLTKKNADMERPIASITKLVTTMVSLDNLDPSSVVILTNEEISHKGRSETIFAGDALTVNELLHVLLIESNNDSALALASLLGIDQFISKMNSRVKTLGMHNTGFNNPSGLDPDNPGIKANYSTPRDISKLLVEVMENYPKIEEISSTKTHNACKVDLSCYKIENTNILLGDSSVPLKVLAGKTGETPRAKKNLAFVIESPTYPDQYIVNVVLESSDHYGDSKKLINWVLNSYYW